MSPASRTHAPAMPDDCDRVYYLATGSYGCEVDDGAIFLDLRTGKYLGVGSDYVAQLRERVYGWPANDRGPAQESRGTDHDLMTDLLQRGVLTTLKQDARMNSLRALPAAESLLSRPAPRTHISLRCVLLFAHCLILAAWRLKRGKLQTVVRQLARSMPTRSPMASAAEHRAMLSALSIFWRLRPWFYTARNYCLLDSVVLAMYLRRLNLPCLLVIGVASKPFQAHAWVQVDDFVVNDCVERIQEFTPILAA